MNCSKATYTCRISCAGSLFTKCLNWKCFYRDQGYQKKKKTIKTYRLALIFLEIPDIKLFFIGLICDVVDRYMYVWLLPNCDDQQAKIITNFVLWLDLYMSIIVEYGCWCVNALDVCYGWWVWLNSVSS